jgi:hypothetical protein
MPRSEPRDGGDYGSANEAPTIRLTDPSTAMPPQIGRKTYPTISKIIG